MHNLGNILMRLNSIASIPSIALCLVVNLMFPSSISAQKKPPPDYAKEFSSRVKDEKVGDKTFIPAILALPQILEGSAGVVEIDNVRYFISSASSPVVLDGKKRGPNTLMTITRIKADAEAQTFLGKAKISAKEEHKQRLVTTREGEKVTVKAIETFTSEFKKQLDQVRTGGGFVTIAQWKSKDGERYFTAIGKKFVVKNKTKGNK